MIINVCVNVQLPKDFDLYGIYNQVMKGILERYKMETTERSSR